MVKRRIRKPYVPFRKVQIAPVRIHVPAGLDRVLWQELVRVEANYDASLYDGEDSPERQALQLLGLIWLKKDYAQSLQSTEFSGHLTEIGLKCRKSGKI